MLAAGAGAYTLTRIGSAQTPSSRRQVTIGGRRIRVIDGHAHCVIPVQHITKGTPLEKMGGGAAPLGPQRLQIMDQQGVDVQALTINNFWWYAADADLARKICLAQNEGLAKWVASHPDRFVATAAVALQHPELAAEQLQDGVKRLGLRGASIGCHVNGEDLSLPKFDPFWSKAAELGVPVFTHPGGAENIIKEGALRGRGELGNIIGNPLETTYFLSRLIFDGTFDKFPGLKRRGGARRRLPAVVLWPHRSRVRIPRQRQVREQEEAERYLKSPDRDRHDGVLGRRASGTSSPKRASVKLFTAPMCRSIGR